MKKIVAVCGMGIGTSVLLKMNIEKVLRELDVAVDVEAADIGTALGAASSASLLLTSEEFAKELKGTPATIIVIDNFFDIEEIRRKLTPALPNK